MANPQKYQDYNASCGPPVWPAPPGEAPRTFEIGLVLAGAVSAGAYIGGVLDFLFEALDAYEAKRLEDIAADKPGAAKRHRVVVQVISGASAGGMSGAMFAAAAQRRFPHVTGWPAPNTATGNPFYAGWVEGVDMDRLLGLRDLAEFEGPPRSLLDCTALDEARDQILSFPQRAGAGFQICDRTWLDDRLKLCFTITNLRGVPYSFDFDGNAGASYAMTSHADLARFSVKLRGNTEARADEVNLCREARLDDPAWQMLGEAALATGSFPLALRARTIVPLKGLFDATFFPDHAQISCPVAGEPSGIDYRVDGRVRHLVDDRGAIAGYSYASADGGVIDNEPLEWARVELAGILGRNPRDAAKACRALIMVDPFPDSPAVKARLAAQEAPACAAKAGQATGRKDAFARAEDETLISLAGGVIAAMKNQGRFHPEDVRLALDSTVYSRFIISPSGRDRPQSAGGGNYTGGAALASGALGGFSGFLSKAYRHHDFMLGRENCRSFLETYFRIPVVDNQGARTWLFEEEPETMEGDSARGRAIVPLYVSSPRAEKPDWPVDACDVAQLRKPIERRIRAVVSRSVATLGPGGGKAIFDMGWGAFGGWASRKAAKSAAATIEQALCEHRLLSEEGLPR
ncbi:patatin-like phospholipase family protein [Novosphingobium huizhouense]|uniref:patatin-like phospholipase family protein n=1 Tax=Novosphingobium huizhouense TaxID=2866625 RepID=UPI001CD8A779|nr:patatin-like phospholipase family protein [Novosphingobium huizhouense]